MKQPVKPGRQKSMTVGCGVAGRERIGYSPVGGKHHAAAYCPGQPQALTATDPGIARPQPPGADVFQPDVWIEQPQGRVDVRCRASCCST
jgi:hypothetical protein